MGDGFVGGRAEAISAAVVAYLGVGVSPFPVRRDDAVVQIAEESGEDGLLAAVISLVAEVHAVGVDWSVDSMASAMARVAAHLRTNHPDLAEQAVSALVWKFAYDWK